MSGSSDFKQIKKPNCTNVQWLDSALVRFSETVLSTISYKILHVSSVVVFFVSYCTKYVIVRKLRTVVITKLVSVYLNLQLADFFLWCQNHLFEFTYKLQKLYLWHAIIPKATNKLVVKSSSVCHCSIRLRFRSMCLSVFTRWTHQNNVNDMAWLFGFNQ